MKKNPQFLVFCAVAIITATCGLAAITLSVFPVFFPDAENSPFLEPMFNTLTYLFSTGVGAIFGLLGARG